MLFKCATSLAGLAEEGMKVDKCREAQRVEIRRRTSVIQEGMSEPSDHLSTHGHILAQTATLAKT